MDPQLNPFKPGAGLTPPALEGRQSQIDEFDLLVARSKLRNYDRGMVLSGLRGVGKTTLLNKLQAHADTHGWLTVAIEARATESGTATIRKRLGQELMRSLRNYSRKVGWKNNVAEPLLKMASGFSLNLGLGPATVSLKPEEQAASGDIDIDIEELVEAVSKAVQAKGSAFGLFIDEMQDLDSDVLSAILAAQHRASQQQWPFFVIGAGLPNLPAELAATRSYAERQFSYSVIGPLNNNDAADAFRIPVERIGGNFVDDALDIVVEASGGYPYFIQEFGKAAWNCAGTQHIMPEDAHDAVEEGWRALDDGFFPSRWKRATDRERRYLRAIAETGEDSPRSAVVAGVMGLGTNGVSDVRDSAIKKGLVWSPEHGRIAFTVPGMADFIRRQRDS